MGNKSMEYGDKSTTLDGTGTFTKKCNVLCIEDAVLDCEFDNYDNTVTAKTGLAITQGIILYNVKNIDLTSGCITCME